MHESEHTAMTQRARRLSGETASLIQEAATHPVLVELNGRPYEVTVRDLSASSPFTVDSAYASITTVAGKHGADLSAEEFTRMMDEAREDYDAYLVEHLQSEG